MQIYKNKQGITIIALIVTIVIMLILLGVGVKIGNGEINRAKLEDLKTRHA